MLPPVFSAWQGAPAAVGGAWQERLPAGTAAGWCGGPLRGRGGTAHLDVACLEAKRLEHGLQHALAVGPRVQRRLGQQDAAFSGGGGGGVQPQHIPEGVAPHKLHVLPALHHAIAAQGKNGRRHTGA